MNQDEWREIIKFLEPIDIFASLSLTSKSLQYLIEECVVFYSDIANGTCCISFRVLNCNNLNNLNIHHHDDQPLNNCIENNNIAGNDEYIRVLGNVDYFTNLYLLKLSIKLGNLNPTSSSMNQIELILNLYQVNLLEFYRNQLLLSIKNNTKMDELYVINNNYVLKYITIGDSRIGKSTYHNIIRNGKFEPFKNIGIDFCIKTITLPNYNFIGNISNNSNNELVIKHQIWDTGGEERFFKNKLHYIKKLTKYKHLLIYCFSMQDENSLSELSEWFEITEELKELKTVILERDSKLIIGLHPYHIDNNTNNINSNDDNTVKVINVVKKAYSLRKSIFLDVNCKEMLNIYSPQWYLQLKYAYFKDLSKLIYIIPARQEEKKEEKTCILL